MRNHQNSEIQNTLNLTNCIGDLDAFYQKFKIYEEFEVSSSNRLDCRGGRAEKQSRNAHAAFLKFSYCGYKHSFDLVAFIGSCAD